MVQEKDKIRVMHTEASLGWGGQERRIMRVMAGLDKDRFEVSLACDPRSRISTAAKEAGFCVHDITMRSTIDPWAVFRLSCLFRRENTDIVHTHSSRDSWNAGLAGRLLGLSLARTRHLAGALNHTTVYRYLTDVVVTVGDYMRGLFVDEYGLKSERVRTIMTGIDLNKFDAEKSYEPRRRQWGFSDEDVVLITVAVMRRKKGHETVLEALRILHDKGVTNAKAVFVGDGPWKEHIQERIVELNLQEHVHLAGLQADVPSYLIDADIFALASQEEALGTCFLEAMAMGLPVLGSRVGGIPSIVRDGRGELFEVDNAQEIAEHLNTLVLDKEKRLAMGRVGRAFALAHASSDKTVEATMALYEELHLAKVGA